MMRLSCLTLMYLACLAILAGCATPKAGMVLQDGSTVNEILAKVVVVDRRGQPVSAGQYPKGLMILFPSISGQIDGKYESKPMEAVPVAVGSDFRLDLTSLEVPIRKASAPLADNPQTRGLSVSPPSAKFARAATVAVDPAAGAVAGGASFMDPASHNVLVLVYADRPCSITGMVRLEGKNFNHQIRLGRPGFHWIRYHRLPNGDFLLKEHVPSADGVQFLIRQTGQRNNI